MSVVGKDFIFIHVPKCAGKSISKRLGGVTEGIPAHAPLSHFSQEQRAGKFAFGFIRNPWDRMVSAYTFITTKPPRPADDAKHRALASQIGFKRWLMETEFYFNHDDRSGLATVPAFQRRSQMYWLEGCDFIGRTEFMDQDFALIERRINLRKSLLYRLRFPAGVERKNATRRSNYQSYYDDESRDFVATYAAPEIGRFAYRFDQE